MSSVHSQTLQSMFFSVAVMNWLISPAVCNRQVEVSIGLCEVALLYRIIKKPDGSDWELGAGAFGRVVKGLRAGVQVLES